MSKIYERKILDLFNKPMSEMTLRDHFAGLAMQAYLSDNTCFEEPSDLAMAAYEIADVMILERDQPE